MIHIGEYREKVLEDTHQTAYHSYLLGDTGTRNEYPRASNPHL